MERAALKSSAAPQYNIKELEGRLSFGKGVCATFIQGNVPAFNHKRASMICSGFVALLYELEVEQLRE